MTREGESELGRGTPVVLVVLGGVNATDPLGGALLDMTDAFDFVFSREADEALPAFCQAYLERGELPDARVVRCAPIRELDGLPMPDYREYYEQLEPRGAGRGAPIDTAVLR